MSSDDPGEAAAGDARAAAAEATARAPHKGLSLWADAWRRLRKNHMAMVGLVVVAVVALLTVLADVLPLEDPTYSYTWIKEQPPGYTHPRVQETTLLERGEPVEGRVHPAYEDAERLTFEVSLTEERKLAVFLAGPRDDPPPLDDNPVELIREGAETPTRIDATGPGEYLQKVRPGGGDRLPPVKGVAIEHGSPLPSALLPLLEGEKENASLIVYRGVQRGTTTFEAELEEGRIRSLTRDGEPAERGVIEGARVLRAEADGVPQTVTHPLGTDRGLDVLSRIVYGGRISLLVGLAATLVSVTIGVVYGAASGYAGGRTDLVLMGIVDVLFGIPYMFLVILLMTFFGSNLLVLFAALGAVQWLPMARIVRGQILSLKEKEFVEAARMSGTGAGSILFRHLIPNTLGVVVVYATLTVPAVILQEAFLSFLGLTPTWDGKNLESWGALVSAGADKLQHPWLLVWPSLALAVTLFSLNFLGDGLRDALDPQQRGRT